MNASVRWNVSHDGYHADLDHWGHSMLETFRASSSRAHHLYVARTGEKPTTPALDFGGALHCLVLEPHEFELRYAVAPKGLGVTKAGVQSRGTTDWKEWAKENEGKTHIKSDDGEVLLRMAEAVMAHPELGAAFRLPHETEVGLRWIDELGVPCKCRPDYLRTSAGVVVDLKGFGKAEGFDTVSLRPDSLTRNLAKLGYHRQHAHYAHGYKALTGEWPRLFLFAFVSRQEPHEVAVYRFDDDAIAVGFRQRRQDYERLALLLDKEDPEAWREVHERGVHELSLPRWAMDGEETAA